MGIIRSKKRPLGPIGIKLDKDITLTSIGAVNIHIPFLVNHVDFFPSSFKLKAHDQVIYIDPLVIEDEEGADYILITHSHQDHFSIADIRRILKKDTVVICPRKVYKKLSNELKEYTIKKTEPGDEFRYGRFSIESMAAYNLKSGIITPHPRSAMNVGYIISIDDIKLYHVGDSDYIPEMNALKNITVVLTPIDGDNLTMSTEKAAELINRLDPKFAIPMHYNIGTDELDRFMGLIKSNTQVIIMDGQSREN